MSITCILSISSILGTILMITGPILFSSKYKVSTYAIPISIVGFGILVLTLITAVFT